MKHAFLLLLVAFTLSSCLVAMGMRNVTNELNSKDNSKKYPRALDVKDGACYAECYMPDRKEPIGDPLFIFTGNENDTDVKVKKIEVVTQAAEKKWVKKKADKNCLSANPDDCLVWCLVDVEEQKETFVVVADTSATDQYELFYREISVEGGPPEWKEVVCEDDITKALIMDVQNKLFAQELYLGPIDGLFDNETRNALANFQKAKGLPVGQLDLETLDVLGVEW